jgi:hypothetical protein
MTLGETNATMNACAERIRGSVVRWLLSLLLSPKRTLERDWQARRRELNAAFAHGRKVRRERIGT